MAGKRSILSVPENVSAEVIGGFVGLGRHAIIEKAANGLFPSTGNGQFPFRESVLAIVQDLRNQAKGNTAELMADKMAKSRADADAAQINAANLRGELITKAGAINLWADAIIAVREILETARFADEAEKLRVLTLFREVRLEEE